MQLNNVNNLNGIPNFGHGFPEDEVEAEVPTLEEDKEPQHEEGEENDEEAEAGEEGSNG